jgi:hypothetical protein
MNVSKLNILPSSNDTSIAIADVWEVGLSRSKQVGANIEIGAKNHVE